jgi:glycerol kinase
MTVEYYGMGRFIAAIDQGTTSSRCILFDQNGPVASAQKEHKQHFPQPGWVEHDPAEIWRNTQEVISTAMLRAQARPGDVAAVGIANQRETCLLWDRRTGVPLGNAIVWQDTRTRDFCDALAVDGGQYRFQEKTGLPLATYFSGPKLRWLLDHIPGARDLANAGHVLFGTIDSWLIWNLTGGTSGGSHVTDVTNASRTMLMNLKTLAWDEQMVEVMGIPANILPQIVSSIDPASWGRTRDDGPFDDAIPVCGCLGDQQAALIGQTCFAPGESKNTYGTGCFMLLNTGTEPVVSRSGLLTTVAYRIAGERTVYALEGSVAIAGALVQWFRDNLNLIAKSSDIEPLARSVADNGGVYIVPAFSGLFAPYWRSDARGIVAGLTGYATKAHLARAVLEATAFQTRDVLDAMRKDSGVVPKSLRVDGGMAVNDLLMQFQADILDLPVIRPAVTETTALGAAYAAGLAVGFWSGLDHLRKAWREDRSWQPRMSGEKREHMLTNWRKAVERSMRWV